MSEHSFLSHYQQFRDVYSELLAASKLDVQDAGGADAIAELTGYHKSSVTRCLRKKPVGEEGRQQSLSLFMLVDLIAFSDQPQESRILDLLLEQAGMMALPMPDHCAVGQGSGAIADLSCEFADLVKEMATCLADDGQISGPEIIERQLGPKALRLAKICLALKRRWEARTEG